MPQENQKPTFKDQFQMSTKELCEKAIKNGWIAALISLSLTLIFASIGLFTQSDDQALNYFLDPWLFFDVFLIAIMAFYIFKKSRIAATLMFAYFVCSKLMQWYDLGTANGLPMALIFMYYYFNAMRGTFIWHSKYNNVEESSELESKI